jgi:hypothetical protein
MALTYKVLFSSISTFETLPRLHRRLMMAEPEKNPIRDEPVKPPMLNPVVRHILPSGDLKWILIAVVLAAAVGMFALVFGTWL